MTIALIGREDSIRAHARVGLVALTGSDGLATSIASSGNEALACASWDELIEHARQSAVDLVHTAVKAVPVPTGRH